MVNEGESSDHINLDLIREEYQDGLEEIDEGSFLLLLLLIDFITKSSIDYLYFTIFIIFTYSVFSFLRPVIKKRFTYPRLGITQESYSSFKNAPLVQKIILWGLTIVVGGTLILFLILDIANFGDYFPLIWGGYSLISCFTYAIWLKIPRFYVVGICMAVGCFFIRIHLFFSIPPLYQFGVPMVLGVGLNGVGIYMMVKFAGEHPKKKLKCPHCSLKIRSTSSQKPIRYCPHCGKEVNIT